MISTTTYTKSSHKNLHLVLKIPLPQPPLIIAENNNSSSYRRKLTWDSTVIDNEYLPKKKCNCCTRKHLCKH